MGILEELKRESEEYELYLLDEWTDDVMDEIKPNAPKDILEKAKRYDDYSMETDGCHVYRNFVEPENLEEWDRIRNFWEEKRKMVEKSKVYGPNGFLLRTP